MPEALNFFSALIFPLFIASMALLVLVYSLVLRAQTTGDLRFAWGAAGAALLLANIHTYDVLPLNVTLLIWAIWSWKRRDWWTPPLLAIAGTLPPLLYQGFVFLNSTEFQVKALTRTAPPPLLAIGASFAALLILACIGGWRLRDKTNVLLVMLWPVVTFCLIFAPVSFGRKMIEGVQWPLCFLAAAGFVWLAGKVKASPRFVIAVGVGVLSLSSFNIIFWCLNNAAENNVSRIGGFLPPLYLTQSDQAALNYLQESSQDKNSAVLCLPFLGNYVPRETGRVAFVGHWAETLNFFDEKTRTGKIVEAQRFYGLTPNPMTPDEARQWLKANRIGWVIIGEYEQRLGASLPLELPKEEQFVSPHGLPNTQLYRVPE